MVEFMITKLEKENRLLTQRELAQAVKQAFKVDVSQQNVSNKLHGCCYALKTVHWEPTKLNTVENKEARKEFCQKLMQARGKDNMMVYIDETNFNIHLTRQKAHAKKGQRATVKRHSPIHFGFFRNFCFSIL